MRHRDERVAAKNKIHSFQKEDSTDDEGDDMGDNEEMKDLPTPPALPFHVSPPIVAGSEDEDERTSVSSSTTSSSPYKDISQSEDESEETPVKTGSSKDDQQTESSVQSPPHASTESLSASHGHSGTGALASSNDSSDKDRRRHLGTKSSASSSSAIVRKPSPTLATTDSTTSADSSKNIRRSSSKPRPDHSATDKVLKQGFIQSAMDSDDEKAKEAAAHLALLQIDDTLAGSSAGEEDEDLSATEDFSDDRDAPAPSASRKS